MSTLQQENTADIHTAQTSHEEANSQPVLISAEENKGRELAIAKFTAAVTSLEEVVEYETDMLEKNENPDYQSVNAKKTRGLRDLNNTMADVARYMNETVEKYVETLLERLKLKLERNSEVLKMHLEAVSELSQMMQAAVRANETDGTYDPFSMNSHGR